jgi:hypothetical protein
MKKFIPLLFAGALLATACQKYPDTDNLDNNYLVYTNYDEATDFQKFTTFYVPDSVLIIDNTSNKPKYLYGTPASDIIIANYVKGMEDAGYVRTLEKDSADLGLQISYIEDTYRFNTLNGAPWWYGYPWYWSFAYWGNWGGWYWPYNISYSYTTGSVLGELIDISGNPSTSKTLRVVWTSYITGLLNSNGSLNTTYVQDAIEQAFEQSVYLKK